MTAALDDVPMTQFVSLETDDEWCTQWAATAPMGEGVLIPFGVPDPEVVSPEAAVNMVIALNRLINWAQGQQVRYLARLATRPGTLPMHSGDGTPREVSEREVIKRGFIREEIACALGVPPHVIQNQLDTAVTIVDRLPRTLESLDTGDLPYGHAAALADAVRHVDDQACAKIETRGSSAPASRRGRVSCVAAPARHDAACEDRNVQFRPEDNAVGTVTALLYPSRRCSANNAVHAENAR